MPLQVQQAVLAAEDRSFYDHGGVSPIGIGRAVWNNVTGGSTQGGSTITQQYAKNAFLTQERSWDRKLKEALLAFPRYSQAAFCVEYVLIPGVNDADEHCDEVCAFLREIRCSLNVIPYNPRRNSPWPAPDERDVDRFIARAVANGQFTKRRGTKGRAAMAACGQLGNERIRRRRFVPLGVDSPAPPIAR